MEKLCSQVYVLRQIALNYIPAHAAFLFNKHYRKQYDNFGCNLELIAMHGKWVVFQRDNVLRSVVGVINFKSENTLFFYYHSRTIRSTYHPFCPNIVRETHDWILQKRCHYIIIHSFVEDDPNRVYNKVGIYCYRYFGCKHNLTEEHMSSYNLRDLFQKASELYEILEKTKKVPLNLKDYVPFEFEFLDTPCEVVTHTRTKQ